MASGKRIPFINVLRLLAMVFVLTPHLLAYQLENQVMIWVGTYVLNPLHIVQYCGALGVSLFYITLQHHFFHLIRMLFLKLLKMFQIISIHKEMNS